MEENKKLDRLKSASDWMRSSAMKAPHRKMGMETRVRKASLSTAGLAVDTAKTILREGRETAIAGDIAKRSLTNDSSVTNGEKKFLKNRGKELAKTLPIVAIEGASQVISPGNMLPTSKLYILAANHKILKKYKLLPTKSAIPKSYISKYKTRKVDKYLNNRAKAIELAKKNLNED